MSALALLLSLPCLYWSAEVGRAAALKEAGIERVCVPPESAEAWRALGFAVVPTSPGDLAARKKLPAPGIVGRAGLASPTRSPWIVAGGWRFLRERSGPYVYDLPTGKASLAAAEAFAYGADALLKIDPTDLGPLGAMLSFLASLPVAEPPPIADLAVVDDGSPLVGEVMNLLVRRNLLFRAVRTPAPDLPLNVKVGTSEYPAREAADPNAFASKVRHDLTDERRSMRIYGSEVVIGRLTGDAARLRLHLLNYGGREIEGVRIRLRGAWPAGEAFLAGEGRVPLTEHVVADGATEFSLARMGVYAVIDLSSSGGPASTSSSTSPRAGRTGLR